MMKELINGDVILPCDSFSLRELFHANGINIRYLGQVAQSFKTESYPYLSILFERVIIVKCIKHLIKENLRDTPGMFHADMIAYFFNRIFGSAQLINSLETNHTPISSETLKKEDFGILNEEDADNKKKKKKKKGNSSKSGRDIDGFTSLFSHFNYINLETPEAPFLSLKPSDIWARLK